MIYHYNHTPIFYEVHGVGPVWVLLHGFLESSKMWDQFVQDFSKNHTIITIDLPGLGKSGCVSEIHTMEIMAMVLNTVLNYLEVKQATFIGHSMGGYIGLAFAEAYSEKVTKLILLNATAQEDNQERKESRNRVLRIVETNREAFIGMAINNLFAEESRVQFKDMIANLKNEAIQFPPEGIKAAIKGMQIRKDRTLVLKKLEGKAFLIYGTEDPLVPTSHIISMIKNTSATFFEIEGGHMSWIENYVKINEIMHLIDNK